MLLTLQVSTNGAEMVSVLNLDYTLLSKQTMCDAIVF